MARREKTSRAIPYVLPDSTIAIENGDVMAVILSSSLTAFPFDSIHPFWHNVGFTININLVEFANSDVGAVFNKDIDGGLGFAYAFGPDRNFAVGITYERISTRRPTEFILGQKGLKVIENGRAITSIDKADNRYYTDSGLNGIAFKFIYHFN